MAWSIIADDGNQKLRCGNFDIIILGPIIARVSALYCPVRAVWVCSALLDTHWTLIGACNPMLNRVVSKIGASGNSSTFSSRPMPPTPSPRRSPFRSSRSTSTRWATPGRCRGPATGTRRTGTRFYIHILYPYFRDRAAIHFGLSGMICLLFSWLLCPLLGVGMLVAVPHGADAVQAHQVGSGVV